MVVRPFDEIFRDFVTDGVPASGPHHPYKPDIRDSLNALVRGAFPDNRVIKLNNANEGTANEIVVSASVDIPTAVYQVLYVLNVTQENTGPVTVSGAINRKLVANTSQPIPAGYLKPGMAVLCIDTGSELRMLSYGDVESSIEELVRQAEAALADAEQAKDQAQNAASDAVSQGNVPIYSTRNAVETLEIPAGINAFRTNGYASPGDGGAALYKKVDTEPSHAGKVQSADGAWWDLSPVNGQIDFAAFGGVDDDVTDNRDAWMGMRGFAEVNPSVEIILTARKTGTFLIGGSDFNMGSEKYRVKGDVTLRGFLVTYKAQAEILEGELKLFETSEQSLYKIPSLVDARYKYHNSAGDLDQSYERAIAFTTARAIQHTPGGGLTPITTGVTLEPRFMSFAVPYVLTNYTGWIGSLIPIKAARSYSIGFKPGSWNSSGIMVVTSAGIHIVYGRQATSGISHTFKPTASSLIEKSYPSAENIGGFHLSDQLGYRFPWANVSLDVLAPGTFIVCVNGVAITPPITDGGSILEAGPVAYILENTSTDPNDSPIFVGITERENPIPASFRGRSVLYIGSSSTDKRTRSWPYHFEDALDKSFGIQIVRSKNIALSGASLSSQKDALAAELGSHLPPYYTDIICFIGANDVQGQSPRAAFQQHISEMIDLADANQCTITFILPQIFYNREDAVAHGGYGAASKNGQLHSLYREYISLVVASKRASGSRCATLDVDRVTGPILSGYIDYPERVLDLGVVDNIHISAYMREQIGTAAARRLVGLLYPKMTDQGGPFNVPSSWLQNGYTAPGAIKFSFREGVVRFEGAMVPGTLADGTAFLQLPVGLRPAADIRRPLISPGSASPAYAFIERGGAMKIYRGAGATTVDLGLMEYRI